MAKKGETEPVEGLGEDGESVPEPGWVEPALASEFPGLQLLSTVVEGGRGRSPATLKEQLAELSNRFGGSQAIMLRQRPIPYAYRVFFRHIGLDPDETRTPIEELGLRRMHDGSFKSRNRLEDALTIAMAEVGVALTAFDADKLEGRLGLRQSEPKEGFEGRVSPLPTGTIVIADEKRPLEILFRKQAEGRGVTKATTRTALVAVGVKGVPDVAMEEALWVAGSAIRA
jgi:DNA/RNA-binding domain of Phe-tRNA-synthetase-like protein